MKLLLKNNNLYVNINVVMCIFSTICDAITIVTDVIMIFVIKTEEYYKWLYIILMQ